MHQAPLPSPTASQSPPAPLFPHGAACPRPSATGRCRPPYRTPPHPTSAWHCTVPGLFPPYSSSTMVKTLSPSPHGKSFLRAAFVQNNHARASTPSPVTSGPSRWPDRRPPPLESGPLPPPLLLLSEPHPPVLPFILFYCVSLLLDFPVPRNPRWSPPLKHRCPDISLPPRCC
jgi:hypothetical protein